MGICTCKDQTFDYEQIESDVISKSIRNIIKIIYIEFKPKEEKFDIEKIDLIKLIYLQSFIRGYLAKVRLKRNKVMPSQTFFDVKVQNNNITNNNDIISQSTIILQKENLITNNLEKNLTIMNFNPSVSRSIEFKKEELIDNEYLNANLVSEYLLFINIL